MPICQDKEGNTVYVISHADAIKIAILLRAWGSDTYPPADHWPFALLIAYYFFDLGHDCGCDGSIFFRVK